MTDNLPNHIPDSLKLFLVIIYDLIIIVGSLWLAMWNHWCWFLLLTWPVLIRTPYWVEVPKENENVTHCK